MASMSVDRSVGIGGSVGEAGVSHPCATTVSDDCWPSVLACDPVLGRAVSAHERSLCSASDVVVASCAHFRRDLRGLLNPPSSRA